MMHLSFSNMRPATDVASQPEIELHRRRIVQTGSGSLYIAAQLASGSLRVTSAFLAIDLSQSMVKTESSRSYHICAPPVSDQFLSALIAASAVSELGSVVDDLSEMVWGAMTNRAWPSDGAPLLPPCQ